MPYPHGPSCRCPEAPPDIGLLKYTVDCDHYEQLAAKLAALADKPNTSALPVLADPDPAPAPPPEPVARALGKIDVVMVDGRPINRAPARQPWEPRPSRNRAA